MNNRPDRHSVADRVPSPGVAIAEVPSAVVSLSVVALPPLVVVCNILVHYPFWSRGS